LLPKTFPRRTEGHHGGKAWTTLDKTKEDKEFNIVYNVKSESARYLSIVYLSLECATNWNGKSIFRS